MDHKSGAYKLHNAALERLLTSSLKVINILATLKSDSIECCLHIPHWLLTREDKHVDNNILVLDRDAGSTHFTVFLGHYRTVINIQGLSKRVLETPACSWYVRG